MYFILHSEMPFVKAFFALFLVAKKRKQKSDDDIIPNFVLYVVPPPPKMCDILHYRQLLEIFKKYCKLFVNSRIFVFFCTLGKENYEICNYRR